MLIYVSGKYSADTEGGKLDNTNKAIDAGIQLIKMGHLPVIPHLSHWMDKRAIEQGVELTWQNYMDIDIELVKRCDAILYISSSKGADIELEVAKINMKQVFTDIDEIPDMSLVRETINNINRNKHGN